MNILNITRIEVFAPTQKLRLRGSFETTSIQIASIFTDIVFDISHQVKINDKNHIVIASFNQYHVSTVPGPEGERFTIKYFF